MMRQQLIRLSGLILLLAIWFFCGAGKANSMFFIALKKSPGFSNTLFVESAESAFQAFRLDNEMKHVYSWVLLSYGPRSGLQFIRRC